MAVFIYYSNSPGTVSATYDGDEGHSKVIWVSDDPYSYERDLNRLAARYRVDLRKLAGGAVKEEAAKRHGVLADLRRLEFAQDRVGWINPLANSRPTRRNTRRQVTPHVYQRRFRRRDRTIATNPTRFSSCANSRSSRKTAPSCALAASADIPSFFL